MTKQQKTKQGMASIYVVVFVTMLIGVITLSFLRVMLSESGRTERDTLADSAYNSAMAGVEDAKAILSKYNECVRSGSSSSTCNDIAEIVKSDTGCDLGDDVGESIVGVGGNDYRGDINDQAYTCVNMTIDGDFKETITNEHPVVVVPMRVKDNDANKVAGVTISWQSDNGNDKSYGSITSGYDRVNSHPANGVLGEMGVNSDDEAASKNGIKVTLIQTGDSYNIDSFYASRGNETNRGTLMLLPTETGGITTIDAKELVDSADKTYNSPLAISCPDSNDRCNAEINFPKPIGGNRNPDTFFLVISKVYSEPNVEIVVNMKDNHGSIIPFHGVQPIIDATGRAGDMLRRVEVRLGTNAGDLVPLAELAVDGDVSKDFFVTKNCINGTEACKN